MSNYRYNFASEFYSDLGQDGKRMISGVGEFSATTILPGHRWMSNYLITCDVNYYRYHLSLESFTDVNLFNQASSVYSNVKDGAGCFGAYMQHTYLKEVF